MTEQPIRLSAMHPLPEKSVTALSLFRECIPETAGDVFVSGMYSRNRQVARSAAGYESKDVCYMTDRKQEMPDSWCPVKLGQVCEINPRRPGNMNRDDDQPTTFVPMEAVDEQTGTILWPQVRPFMDVKRGYTYFAERDVLFSKITPCMQNGKHAIAYDLIDGLGFGTTEFHVIRSSPIITPEWIHLFLRQPRILQAAEAHFTGSVGQQRVPRGFLDALEIPLPPLQEQKRLVAILNEKLAAVEKARAAAQAQLEIINKMPAALLRQAFNGEL
jgi:type I restriction enzyme S subunit